MMKRLVAVLAVILSCWLGVMAFAPVEVSAWAHDASCNDDFLNFRAWYHGIAHDSGSGCVIASPGEDELSAFVWTIVLNILSILFGIVGYIALGFIIYGAYLYVLARGDPNRIAKGKRTLTAAIVGLILCILASLIVNTIVYIITEATH